MSEKKYTKDDCLLLLNEKFAELTEHGDKRYPKRSDFSEQAVVAIKAFLGPWPRALEAAGVKPPRDGDRKQKNREKRAKAKRARREALKNSSSDLKKQEINQNKGEQK